MYLKRKQVEFLEIWKIIIKIKNSGKVADQIHLKRISEMEVVKKLLRISQSQRDGKEEH